VLKIIIITREHVRVAAPWRQWGRIRACANESGAAMLMSVDCWWDRAIIRGGSDVTIDRLIPGKAGCGKEQAITRHVWSQICEAAKIMIEHLIQIYQVYKMQECGNGKTHCDVWWWWHGDHSGRGYGTTVFL